MKRLFAFVLSAVMVISCTMMPAVAVEANSKNDNTSPTRDYMQLQHTETVCYNSNSVSITVSYGVREDFSNSSGYRIVAIGVTWKALRAGLWSETRESYPMKSPIETTGRPRTSS